MIKIIVPRHVWKFLVVAWVNFLTQNKILLVVDKDLSDFGQENFVLNGRFTSGGEDVVFMQEESHEGTA